MSEATRTWLPSGASPTIRVHGRGSKTTASGLATLSFLTHSRQHATRISPRSCKINWKAVGTPRKVAPNGEGRRGLHIIMIPPKPRKANPETGETGKEKGGTKGAAPEREKPNKGGEPRRTPDQPKPRQFSSPGTGLGLCCAQGGDVSALGSCPPPGVCCASVPDGRSAG